MHYFRFLLIIIFMFRICSFLLSISAAIAGLASCSKNQKNCPFLPPQIIYVNFTDAETDTMIIRRFEKNSGFLNLLDTILVSRPHIVKTPVGNDSVRLEPDNYPVFQGDFYSYDWQVYFPGNSRLIPVEEIIPQFAKEKEASAQCQSFVSSLSFDNQRYNFYSWAGNAYRVFAVNDTLTQ